MQVATKTVKARTNKLNWIQKICPTTSRPPIPTTDNQDNARRNETRNNKRDIGKFQDNNHSNKSNYNSNNINKKDCSKKVRRSKKKKQSNNNIKILYANARGLKAKLRDIKMILFDIKPNIPAFVQIKPKTQEKIAVSGYTWVGKYRQHKEWRGVGYFIKNTIKNFYSCWTRHRNTMDQAKIKKATKLIYRRFIWKTREQTLCKRIRKIIWSNRKIDI